MWIFLWLVCCVCFVGVAVRVVIGMGGIVVDLLKIKRDYEIRVVGRCKQDSVSSIAFHVAVIISPTYCQLSLIYTANCCRNGKRNSRRIALSLPKAIQ